MTSRRPLPPAPGDAELLSASDQVHESLESLGLSHQAYTGHTFLQGPLYREPFAGPDELWAQLLEADEVAEATEEDEGSHVPSPRELGSTLVFDRVLHQSATEVLRLDMAKVFTNGVLLVIDYVNLRETDEDGPSWFRRGNEQHGNVELALELHDPSNGAAYVGELHWADANIGPRCYTLNNHFWVHRATDAQGLLGSLTVTDAIAVDGSMDPLAIEVRIDTVELRKAGKRVRSFGIRGPNP